MASYARSWARFQEAGLRLAGISVDTPEQNRAMIEKLGLPFPLLSDPESRVIREWGVLNEREQSIAVPSLFLVAPDLGIRFSYIGEDFTDRPTDEELWAGARDLAG